MFRDRGVVEGGCFATACVRCSAYISQNTFANCVFESSLFSLFERLRSYFAERGKIVIVFGRAEGKTITVASL